MPAQGDTSEQAAWSDDALARDPHCTADKSERVRRMFGAIAHRYDLNNRLHSLWRDQAWRRCAVRLAGVTSSSRVLDVACGTGDLTRLFVRAGAASVEGVDFTPEMLEIAIKKGPGSIAYMEADAMALPFADSSFDVVSIAFGIRNVSDAGKALDEFYRVLVPGGRLVVLEFSEPGNRLLRVLNRLYTHRVMPVTATLLARDRSGAYKYLPRSVRTFLDRGALCSAIGQAGFVEVTQHPMTFGVCVCYRGVKGS